MESGNILKFLILLFVFTGCSKEETQGDLISYKVLKEDLLSYHQEQKLPSQELFLEGEQEWREFLGTLAEYDSSRALKLEEIEINFDTTSLIVIVEEFQVDCCNSIEVSGIYERKDKVIVVYHIKDHPGVGFAALSQAIKILEIPKTVLPVEFE